MPAPLTPSLAARDEALAVVRGRARARPRHPPGDPVRGGLGPAIRALADRSPCPVEVDARLAGSHRRPIGGDRLLRRVRGARERREARRRDDRRGSAPRTATACSGWRSRTTAREAPIRPARAARARRIGSAPWAATSAAAARPEGGTVVTASIPLAERRSGSSSPTTRRSSARASSGSSRMGLRGRRPGGRRGWAAGARGRRDRPTSRSSTSACRRRTATRDRGDDRIRAETGGAIAVLVLSQYLEPEFALRLLEDGARGSATCSRTGSPTSPSSWTPFGGSRRVAR